MTIATTKTLNLAMFIAGVAEAGKSTYVRELMFDWLERGGWAFVHDPTRSYGLPTFDSWASYLDAAGQCLDEHGLTKLRAVAFTCPWSEVVAGMKALGRAVNSEHNVRMPMLLVGDESTGIDSSSRTHMGPADQELLGQRRHFGIAVVVNMQSVADLPKPFWGRLTDIIVLRLGSPDDVALIEKSAELPAGMLASATTLDQYTFLHVRRGFVKELTAERLWEVPA